MHWLSTPSLPFPLTQHLHHAALVDSPSTAIVSQAKRDWENILLQRGRELARGGRMLLINFCIDEDGRYLGNTRQQKHSAQHSQQPQQPQHSQQQERGDINVDAFERIWRGMRDESTITAEEYLHTNFPRYYKPKKNFSPHSRIQPIRCTLSDWLWSDARRGGESVLIERHSRKEDTL